jgi:small subunit ribosomal protein S1
MAKNKNFGDQRRFHLEFFEDTLTQESKDLKREDLEALYKEFDIKIPVEDKLANVTYLGFTEEDILFDGGFKDFVRIEKRNDELKYLVNTNVGDKIDVLITKVDEDNFEIKGSLVELYEKQAKKRLLNSKESVVVSAHVKELTPAGYSVDIFFEGVTLPGFMPNTLAGINKLSQPEAIVGETFEVMIESFSKDEGTYIVSRRRYLQTLIPQAIKELRHGVVYEGLVTGTTQFGIFVEFKDCLTGMIHKTNIKADWADRIDEILPGFVVQFYVKEIIKDKIILTQILRESLWDTIKVGQIMTGKVRDSKSFGVLVALDDETNGLIHTSELEKSNRKLSAGQDVKVRIIAVDRMNRKIFLSVVSG